MSSESNESGVGSSELPWLFEGDCICRGRPVLAGSWIRCDPCGRAVLIHDFCEEVKRRLRGARWRTHYRRPWIVEDVTQKLFLDLVDRLGVEGKDPSAAHCLGRSLVMKGRFLLIDYYRKARRTTLSGLMNDEALGLPLPNTASQGEASAEDVLAENETRRVICDVLTGLASGGHPYTSALANLFLEFFQGRGPHPSVRSVATGLRISESRARQLLSRFHTHVRVQLSRLLGTPLPPRLGHRSRNKG